ncbi:MAG: DUF1573 domain-containing protein [Anaerolineae bacterium]
MSSHPSNANQPSTVVIQIDSRAVWGLLIVIGLAAVLVAGFWIGRSLAGPNPQAGARVASQFGAQPPGGQVVPQQETAPQSQVPAWQRPGPGENPNILKAAPPSVPIGDNPRLALPDLEGTNYVYDFGTIYAEAPPVEETLVVKNIGTKPLVIDKVVASCGCTAALLSDSTIPPGGEGTIKLTHDGAQMKAHGQLGPVTHYVDILSNDPAAPQVRFVIQGTVVEGQG